MSFAIPPRAGRCRAAPNLYAAADYLGMTAETLERVYGHLRPDHHAGVGHAITGKRPGGAHGTFGGPEVEPVTREQNVAAFAR